MNRVDLDYCFKEQIDAGNSSVFFYMLENRPKNTFTVERFTGSLDDLLPTVSSYMYVKKTETQPIIPQLVKE